MKKILTGLFILFSFGVLAQEGETLADLLGIPVLGGLTENSEARLVFDKPEGRIIQAELAGNVPRSQALDFYRETLFQLGWSLEGQGNNDYGEARLTFIREGEQLVLIVTGGNPLKVNFELGPALGNPG